MPFWIHRTASFLFGKENPIIKSNIYNRFKRKGGGMLKFILIGATAMLSGIILFGMTWIATAIYSTGYGRFAEALSAIGYFPLFISIILALTGICFFVMGFNKHLEGK